MSCAGSSGRWMTRGEAGGLAFWSRVELLRNHLRHAIGSRLAAASGRGETKRRQAAALQNARCIVDRYCNLGQYLCYGNSVPCFKLGECEEMVDVDVALNQIVAEKHRLADLDLVHVLAEPQELPALPAIAVRVMRITADSKGTLPELTRVIEADEALASKILKFSNSALYGRGGTVSTLKRAITALGFLTVRWLAVTASAHTLFRKDAKRNSDHKMLWEHSLKCAIGSRLLTKRISLNKVQVDEAFVAGLLHDIGKLAILDRMPGYISQFYDWCEVLSLEFFEVERDVIGTDHSEVSRHIFKHWNFPSSLSDAVVNHHSPESAKEGKVLAQVLFTVDKFFPLREHPENLFTSEDISELPLMVEHSVSEKDIADLRDKTAELYFEIADLLGA